MARYNPKESEPRWRAAWEAEAGARHGLELLKHTRAGAVHGHLLQRVA